MLTSLLYLLNVIFTKDAGFGAPRGFTFPKNIIAKILKQLVEFILVTLPGLFFLLGLMRISFFLSLPFPPAIRQPVDSWSFTIILFGVLLYGLISLARLRKCRKENKSFFPENMGTKERKLRAAVAYIASTVAIVTFLGFAMLLWGVTNLYTSQRWGIDLPLPIIDL